MHCPAASVLPANAQVLRSAQDDKPKITNRKQAQTNPAAHMQAATKI
jgi:hypothetical protein